MLTPDQIAALRDAAGQITDPINNFLIADIARRIAGAGQLTSSAAYQIWRAQQLGMSQQKIEKELKKLLNKSSSEVEKLLTQSAKVGYDFDIKRLPTTAAVSFEQNATIQRTVDAAVRMALSDFTNLTQTTAIGFTDPSGQTMTLLDAYRSCMDFAFEQVFTGSTDYNTAIRRACKNIATQGVQWVDYESGAHTSLEAAVRRNIMGGMGLMQEQISQQNHDDMGCDGWEISAHANSAPDHEPIQGRQYSDDEYTELNDSLVRRIGTLNCGHVAFPIILGVSSPQYTEKQLQEFKDDNAAGVTYQGRHYTGYEATQMQRKVERTIRTQKRRILVDDATGDKDKLQTDQIRLVRLNDEYVRFSKATGLRTQRERAQVAGFGRSQAAKATAAAKSVEIVPKRATMIENKAVGEGVAVHTIGRIDIEKYKCVAPDITTDEVIMTDERIQHIKDHHPDDFERYEQYLRDVVETPDFILGANKPNTAFLLKEIHDADKRFQMIVRLKVVGDPEDYKNSVITFLKISEKKWNKYLRNKKILYKSE